MPAGGSLSDYLVRNKMDEDVARYFFKQLLAAIRYWCVFDCAQDKESPYRCCHIT